jgi:uncharacterized protein (TIGR03067 family)
MNQKLLLYIAAGSLLAASTVFGAEIESGFTSLFNGKDLSGWDGDPKLWSVKNGVITGQTTAESPAKHNTFLIWTNGEVADFELRCSFKLTPGDEKKFANSGIQYRSKILDPAGWVVGGYQADMEAGQEYTGILYEERFRGIMATRGEKVVWDNDCNKQVTGSLGTSQEIQAAVHQGDWNDYVIIAQGNHLQQFVNGKQTVDVTDECESKRAASGVLALQLHAGPSMMAQFRNIRIKTLGEASASAADDDQFRPFQGSWQVVSVEAGGNPVPPEQVTNIVVRIKGNAFTVENADNIDRGTFTIDNSRNPRRMDIRSENGGGGAGAKLVAIYEVNGDSFRVCYAPEGVRRPGSFSSADDDRLLLITYKRIKP